MNWIEEINALRLKLPSSKRNGGKPDKEALRKLLNDMSELAETVGRHFGKNFKKFLMRAFRNEFSKFINEGTFHDQPGVRAWPIKGFTWP